MSSVRPLLILPLVIASSLTTSLHAADPGDGITGKWVVKEIGEAARKRATRFPYRVDFKPDQSEKRSWVHVHISALALQSCGFELRGQQLIGVDHVLSADSPIGLCTTTMDGGGVAAGRCHDRECADVLRQDDTFLTQLFLTGADLKWHRAGIDLVVESWDGRKRVLLTRWTPRKPPIANQATISPRFKELAAKVSTWRARLHADVLEEIDDVSSRITDCNLPVEETGAAIVEIDQVTYKYENPLTSENTFCVYLSEPEHRPLSANEGRILLQAVQTSPRP